jgi:N-acetylneuraminate synthase
VKTKTFTINGKIIGQRHPTYIIAEMSANHNRSFDNAVKIIEAAKESGADAIKVQTYTPDTITLDSHGEYFKVKGSIWDGRYLYDLYSEAYTPWEWQPELKQVADSLGLDFFSTPFDSTAVDFLKEMNVPAYKIASFELVDIPLIKKVAQTHKPLLISTGMATLAEIREAINAAMETGNDSLALLKCTSAYPALPEDMNLNTIVHLSEEFGIPVGLSDHTLGIEVAVAAVSLGACIVEKHFTLSRNDPGPDCAFSMEPAEFRAMVDAVKTVEKALGDVKYGAGSQEESSLTYRRSLFAVEDIKKDETFTEKNIRSIRPAYGLHPRFLNDVLGHKAKKDIEKGTPLNWELIA